ncbi:MAG: hypothetical protein H0V51_03665 [Chloroflexi bacterium]|nr:hypothetical protein [Chloroflexota bacterium]
MIYTTITRRGIDLEPLSSEERAFLARLEVLFRKRPDWDEFARAWGELGRAMLWKEGTVPVGHPVYRICQDLEMRLGITQGLVAPPDYRDQLVDLIEERFGSAYRFCQATGIDQGHLSRVLAGKKHFSQETFAHVLEALGVEIVLMDRAEVAERAWLDVGPVSRPEQGAMIPPQSG